MGFVSSEAVLLYCASRFPYWDEVRYLVYMQRQVRGFHLSLEQQLRWNRVYGKDARRNFHVPLFLQLEAQQNYAKRIRSNRVLAR